MEIEVLNITRHMKTQIKKAEFLAKIIHDLKTPTIAQIKALESFLATSSGKINEEERDLIELTLNSCNYMQKLIEIFSAVYKLDYEQINLNYEKFDIIELINNTIKELSILLKYYDLKIEFPYNGELIVNADKLQIKRVIENLISNSINYAQKNTTVYINTFSKKGEVTVEIKNNSSYIEPAVLKEIFEKYKTFASCYNRAGVGLGLYLSKEIIHAHFGKMIAKSYPDDINIFGFVIPEK